MEQIPILDVLRRRVSMIIALCIVATVAGYAFSFLIPERYSAAALVLVRPQQPIKIGGDKAGKEILDFPMGQSTSVETPSKSYIEIIKSPELLGKVVRKLGLDKPKEEESGGISNLISPYLARLVTIVKYGRLIHDDPFTRAVKALEDNLSQKSREDTYLFEIAYKAKDPQLAADVVNTTASLFIESMEEIRTSEAQFARDQLLTQLDQNQKLLATARQKLQSYKEVHSIFNTETEYTSRLKIISDLEVEIAKAEAAFAGNQSMFSNVSAAARLARLVRSLREQEAERAPLPEIERNLRQLELDLSGALTAYQLVDKEFKEADIKRSYASPEIRLVSRAIPLQVPSSPSRITIALASLLGGLVVAVGLAFFLEYLNQRVRGVDDVEDFVGVKVLATIPRVSPSRWHRAGLQ